MNSVSEYLSDGRKMTVNFWSRLPKYMSHDPDDFRNACTAAGQLIQAIDSKDREKGLKAAYDIELSECDFAVEVNDAGKIEGYNWRVELNA